MLIMKSNDFFIEKNCYQTSRDKGESQRFMQIQADHRFNQKEADWI